MSLLNAQTTPFKITPKFRFNVSQTIFVKIYVQETQTSTIREVIAI